MDPAEDCYLSSLRRTLVLPVIFAARVKWLKKDKKDEECDATKAASSCLSRFQKLINKFNWHNFAVKFKICMK